MSTSTDPEARPLAALRAGVQPRRIGSAGGWAGVVLRPAGRIAWRIAVAAILLVGALGPGGRGAFAATPSEGTLSSDSPQVTWQGTAFLASNPAACVPLDPVCDTFRLTLVPPAQDFVVRIVIEPSRNGDDLDLFVFGPDGELVDSSATESGYEEVTLSNPPAGTYEVAVQPFLVVPGGSYRGSATLDTSVQEPVRAYRGTRVGPDFQGVPANQPAPSSGPALKVQTAYVGRRAAEPTLGVNRAGTAFFAAADFDSILLGETARTLVMRSTDGGKTWQSVQPALPPTTEPPTTLDPYVYVEPQTGRVFSIDLYAACSWLIYSDDEGATWTRNALACGDPVNDHHTIVAGLPLPGLTPRDFPKLLYYCFNRVGDSSCGRSLDGGDSFFATRDPAFLGVDPEAGGVCGGLHGHLATDNAGRLFLPKGHCGFPWIAISEDGGDSWRRVRISGHVPIPHHEVSVAVDSADNLYAVWWDARHRLPYLATSTDHGRTWSVPLMIAPPGVHEVNFPTIAAGDAGRVAINFPGTTVDDTSDTTRPWNQYLVVSTDALDADPTFVWTTANDPSDPIHRGDCGPGRCGGMFDFLDIQVSPSDGKFWATASDTCVGGCVTNPSGARISPGEGVAIRQVKGPKLWAPGHKKSK